MKKNRYRNPFTITFSFFALVCCLIIGVLLFTITYQREKALQQFFYQEKLDVILDDFDLQLEALEKLSLSFAINHKYSYSALEQHTYNEKVLLQDFEANQYASTLTENLFLYYHDHDPDNIFHSSGTKINLILHLNNLSDEETNILCEALAAPSEEMMIYSLSDKLYILIPFRTLDVPKRKPAILVSAISYKDLLERFEFSGGQLDGILSFYMDDRHLFSNADVACTIDDKQAYSVTSRDKHFTICYKPDKKMISSNNLLSTTLFLLTAFLLILLICKLFADVTYKPIKLIRDKYDNKLSRTNKDHNNIFHEIDNIINSTLQENIQANMQLEHKNDLLKHHVLRRLLNGSYSVDLAAQLDKLDILQFGLYYYVITIAFTEEVTPDFLLDLQTELEQTVADNTSQRLYVTYNYRSRQIWCICSLAEKQNEAELTEYVFNVAHSCPYQTLIGIGNIYSSLSKISASWLESIENLGQSQIAKECNITQNQANYHFENLHWLEHTLKTGDAKATLDGLRSYIQCHTNNQTSYLLQLCTFSEFVGEISRISKQNGIDLSNQAVALLISAKNSDDFYEAAAFAIEEYCSKYHLLTREKYTQENMRILEYINKHFTEYSLSIETVAADLGITNVAVREAILQATGKKYKDYLLDLRIDYAKKLLVEENSSVAEVCAAVGYVSTSYFIASFKEKTGVTPAKYAKERQIRKPSSTS